MPNFRVNTEKCISCGLCAGDCLFSLLEMIDGHPVLARPEQCILCLHCFAICPVGAISMDEYRPEEAKPICPIPKKDEMEALVRQRRSIRKFRQENCSPDEIDNILKMAWDAPSGGNQHLLLISSITDMIPMGVFKTRTYELLKKTADAGDSMARTITGLLGPDQSKWLEKDFLFRHAPHMVVSTYPKNAMTGQIDSIIYLTYFEMLARSNGLGTIWMGFADWCVKSIPELGKFLKIPEDYQIGYTMLFGKPDIQYKRGIERKNANIQIIK